MCGSYTAAKVFGELIKLVGIVMLCVFGLAAVSPYPAGTNSTPSAPRYEIRAEHDPNGIGKFYLGREIAGVMGHQAADWLERPERQREERTDLLVPLLKLKPGDTVADIGAGTGYYTRLLANAVGTNSPTGDTGLVYAEDIQPEMLDILTNKMTEHVARNIRNVFHLSGWGSVHASVGQCDTVWSVPIDRIPLHARFRLINQVLMPMFASSTDIEMPLVWKVPAAVKVVFVVGTKFDDPLVRVDGNWLFACDPDNRGYRLPLPNLHDDCRLCTGAFEGDQETAFECVRASLNQFNQSKWNADLMRTIEQSQKFFRFQPTQETFETLPIQADNWTTLCDKVSTAIMERVIV